LFDKVIAKKEWCSFFTHSVDIRKVEIAIALQLRPPDVAPVVLGFNYEARNTPAYKFNNSARDILVIHEHL